MNKKLEIILIAAVAENRVIGNKGEVPWDIPEDKKRLHKLISGYPVIMGRKTYEIYGPGNKSLKNSTKIVVTRSQDFHPNGIIVSHTIEDAIEKAKEYDEEKIYIIGGGEIFKQSIDLATKLNLTEVKEKPEGDTYFPEIDEDKWAKGTIQNFEGYSFVTYVRKK